jgi:hypothetical protein
MKEVLAVINDQMESLGLNYEFGEMSESPPKYPYWVGEYSEPEGMTEDGKEEPTVILTGFSRGKFAELERQKSIIKDHFKHGVSVITESGSAVVIFYGGSFPIPLEDDDLKKQQVNLSIKTWKGN